MGCGLRKSDSISLMGAVVEPSLSAIHIDCQVGHDDSKALMGFGFQSVSLLVGSYTEVR